MLPISEPTLIQRPEPVPGARAVSPLCAQWRCHLQQTGRCASPRESSLPANPARTAELLVAATSSPLQVAHALVARLQMQHQQVVTAIGAEAVSRAVRAIALARLRLTDSGSDVVVNLRFQTRQMSCGTRTMLCCHCLIMDVTGQDRQREYPVSVTADTPPGRLAGFLARLLRAGRAPRIQASGSAATYVAMLATATAISFMAPNEDDFVVTPSLSADNELTLVLHSQA